VRVSAELVLQVISERNERASLIVTTNLPFGEWTKVFPRRAPREGRRGPHRRFRHGLARGPKKGAN
jgi:DNA replication protein DnaC